jgi:3-methyladenine DNA glycosylase AlkD
MMTIDTLRNELKKHSSKKQAKTLQWFFKTGPGEYAEGDVFMGVKVPAIRAAAKKHAGLRFKDAVTLLKSAIHEERLAALLIFILKYSGGNDSEKERIYRTYLGHTRYVNNWDLVDLTAEHIVGAFLTERTREPLYRLARSRSLWERRIAILATFRYIKNGAFNDTLAIARIVMRDREDLIHKAAGWMLREIGKRDMSAEEKFLKKYHTSMPRTMLRYAIERFPESKRQSYLTAGRRKK